MHRHDYQMQTESDGSWSIVCARCGKVKEHKPARINQRKVLSSD